MKNKTTTLDKYVGRLESVAIGTAALLIKDGLVKLNGNVCTNRNHIIVPGDYVEIGNGRAAGITKGRYPA